MKVLIVGFFTKTYMPYINNYEKVLSEKNISYDVVCFDRDSTGKVKKEGNVYTFSHKTTANKFAKLFPVFRYGSYVKKIIKENKYDKIIVLTTMPGILIYNILLKKYSGKYIFDYRDYTYEKYSFFRKMVNRIIDNSYATFISSDGYKRYFNDQKNIYLCHNISNIDDVEKNVIDLKKKKNINIGFLGYVRYFDVNSKLINDFKNDKKYSLTYIGTPFSDCDLESFCKSNDIKNVTLIGKYDNNDKAKLYKNIDLINSIYSLSSEEVQPAIPNRLYDAALFKKPIIVNNGTYLSEIVEKNGLGLILDPFNSNIKEVVEKYIDNFDSNKFKNNCNKFLNEIKDDQNNMIKKINDFLK